MTVDSFYSLSLVWLLNNQKYLREKAKVTSNNTHRCKLSSVKLYWHLGIFNFILRLRQIEYVVIATIYSSVRLKGELNPKMDFSSFEHLGIVEQLYEVFKAVSRAVQKKIDVL